MQDRKEYMRQYRLENKERIRILQEKYYAANKEDLLCSYRQYYTVNRQKLREKGKLHYEENKSLYLHYSRFRKSLLIKRTPRWLSDSDILEIKSIYKRCKDISEQTGILHHVDHIVPLQGKFVSGLHVPSNLRIITAEENLTKSNKYE